MTFCYCDATGTGEEPFAVLLGVVVDASRMHVTKTDWRNFLAQLSEMVGQEFQGYTREISTQVLESGKTFWAATFP